MHILRRSLGLIPLSVGVVGLLVCVLAAGVLWIAGARVERLSQMLFTQADQLFAMADRQVERAAQGLNEANDILRAAELGLDQDITEQKVKDFLAKPEVAILELKLRSYVTEVEGLIKVIETSEEWIRQGCSSLSWTMPSNPSITGSFLDSLGKTRLALLRLLRVASDAEACWITLNQGRELESNAHNLLRMNALIQRQLDEVSGSVAETKDRLALERKSWQEFSFESSRYIKLGQYIGIAFFAWIGLGQYALALCGVLRLRCGRTSTVITQIAEN